MKISSGQEYAAKIINTKKLSARGRKHKHMVTNAQEHITYTNTQEEMPRVSLSYVWLSCERTAPETGFGQNELICDVCVCV